MDYLYVPNDDTLQHYVNAWAGGYKEFDTQEEAMAYALNGLGEHYGGFESTMRIHLNKKQRFHAVLVFCEVVVQKTDDGKWSVHDF